MIYFIVLCGCFVNKNTFLSTRTRYLKRYLKKLKFPLLFVHVTKQKTQLFQKGVGETLSIDGYSFCAHFYCCQDGTKFFQNFLKVVRQ